VSEYDQPPAQGGEEPRVVVRDRRRIDPETGEIRTPDPSAEEEAAAAAGTGEAGEPAPSDGSAELKAQLDERTADLQRLQAEFANYRKRVERDREATITNAKASLATQLLGVLDDVERAAAHGDLTGAFKSVADKLSSTLQQAGLTAFGHEGEPFDPSVHEAVQHDTSPDVTEPTVTAVLRRGYRFGDRVVRAALVAVTDHGAAPEPAEPNGGAAAGEPDAG
jgi:molecular chaperone GrpE